MPASGRDPCRSSCRSGSPSAARRNRRAARLGAAGTRDHRRPDGALHAVRRALPSRVERGRHRASLACDQHPCVRRRLVEGSRPGLRAGIPRGREPHRRERGWPPSGRAEYDALAGPAGPLAAGSPEEVAEKIVASRSCSSRSGTAHISIGAVEHKDVMRDRALRHACRSTRPSGYACGTCAAGRLGDRVSARASRHQMSS
jgi:hypothetical protein